MNLKCALKGCGDLLVLNWRYDLLEHKYTNLEGRRSFQQSSFTISRECASRFPPWFSNSKNFSQFLTHNFCNST